MRRFWFLQCVPQGPPSRFGTYCRQGWLGYRRGEVHFNKRFAPQPGAAQTDLGWNAEVYVCNGYLELESLGQLSPPPPGPGVVHEERWLVGRLTDRASVPSPYDQALEALAADP